MATTSYSLPVVIDRYGLVHPVTTQPARDFVRELVDDAAASERRRAARLKESR